MSEINNTLISKTNTRKRRHNLFCSATVVYAQNEPIAWLMLRSFRESGERRQAELIEQWFINDQIPKELESKSFITEINLKKRESIMASIPLASSLPQTPPSSSKGGFASLFTPLRRKSSTINAGSEMYDNLEEAIAFNIIDGMPDYPNSFLNPDQMLQPNPVFARQTQYLKLLLAAYTFDPDRMGIY